MRRAILTIGAALLVVGCGNFFPNPDNVQLPPGTRAYTLACGRLPQGECERRATEIIVTHPGQRIVRMELQDDGYTITFDDGTMESMIAN